MRIAYKKIIKFKLLKIHIIYNFSNMEIIISQKINNFI